MIIKFSDERKGRHIHSRIFMGQDEDHLALTGTLVMDMGEWQVFGAALLIGARGMHGNLTVEMPDSRDIVIQKEEEVK